VRDLESRNGTLVNGAVVEEHWLQHGDEIGAGDTSFLFLLEDDDVAAPGRVEFEDGQRTAETDGYPSADVVYLQPERLQRELPATSQVARNLNALLKISRIVHAIRDLDELQGQLLDLIFGVVPAGRGAILLADKEGHQFNSMFARHAAGGADTAGEGEPHGGTSGAGAGDCDPGYGRSGKRGFGAGGKAWRLLRCIPCYVCR